MKNSANITQEHIQKTSMQGFVGKTMDIMQLCMRRKWTWWDYKWEKQTIFKWELMNIKNATDTSLKKMVKCLFLNDVAVLTTCFYHVR